MKKIEKKIVKTLLTGRQCPEGTTWNLSPRDSVENECSGMSVYLHDHHIATVHSDSVVFSLRGWNTPTTRGRLNAVLTAFACRAKIFQKDFRLFLDLNSYIYELDSTSIYEVREGLLWDYPTGCCVPALTMA